MIAYRGLQPEALVGKFLKDQGVSSRWGASIPHFVLAGVACLMCSQNTRPECHWTTQCRYSLYRFSSSVVQGRATFFGICGVSARLYDCASYQFVLWQQVFTPLGGNDPKGFSILQRNPLLARLAPPRARGSVSLPSRKPMRGQCLCVEIG